MIYNQDDENPMQVLCQKDLECNLTMHANCSTIWNNSRSHDLLSERLSMPLLLSTGLTFSQQLLHFSFQPQAVFSSNPRAIFIPVASSRYCSCCYFCFSTKKQARLHSVCPPQGPLSRHLPCFINISFNLRVPLSFFTLFHSH